MAKLKSTPIDDFYGKGVIRPDGRFAHDMYLMREVPGRPSEGTMGLLQRSWPLPADQVWTQGQSKCALWK